MPKPLNQQANQPQLSGAFAGWTSRITLNARIQRVRDGLVCHIDNKVSFNGMIQPLSEKKIQLKPEGQRAWKWLQIHCLSTSLDLDVNDIIEYNGRKFKIMADNDYSLNGFIEYHAAEDYQNG